MIATAVVIVAGLLALFVKVYNETSPPKVSEAAKAPTYSVGPSESARAPRPGSSHSADGAIGPDEPGTPFPSALTNKLRTRSMSGPAHTVRLVVTSGGPVARVGYLVPTSESEPYGNLGAPASPWSMTMTAHGSGYLAAVFVQAGRGGEPVTCRIMIDGVTKSVRTTNGSYARQMCLA